MNDPSVSPEEAKLRFNLDSDELEAHFAEVSECFYSFEFGDNDDVQTHLDGLVLANLRRSQSGVSSIPVDIPAVEGTSKNPIVIDSDDEGTSFASQGLKFEFLASQPVIPVKVGSPYSAFPIGGPSGIGFDSKLQRHLNIRAGLNFDGSLPSMQRLPRCMYCRFDNDDEAVDNNFHFCTCERKNNDL